MHGFRTHDPHLLCAALVCFGLGLSGCSMIGAKKAPQIVSGGVKVSAPTDAGKPATLAQNEAKTTIAAPAGTTVDVKRTEARPATAEIAFTPAVVETHWSFPEPVKIEQATTAIQADTGTVDTSVAKAKIQAEESRVLLYASLAAAALGALFVYLAYPTPAIICGGASVVFFLAWKVSGMPSWIWGIGLAGVGAGLALYLGHERGEKSAKQTSNS